MNQRALQFASCVSRARAYDLSFYKTAPACVTSSLFFFLQMALLYSLHGFFNFNPTQRGKLREIAPSKYLTQNPAVTVKVQN